MSLIKWFRRNNKKILAIFVSLLLIGLLGGPYFSRLARRGGGRKQTFATFSDGRELTNYDVLLARQELEVLEMLQADLMLKSSVDNLHFFLLGELLFPERALSPILLNRLKQTIRNNGLKITDRQLQDIYKTGVSRDIIWLLLTKETEQAGITVPNESARSQLMQIMQQLYNNLGYINVIGPIVQRTKLPEEQIINIFGKLLAVATYAGEACSNDSLTNNQLSRLASYQQETIDAELVRFNADLFEDDQNKPSNAVLIEQFEKFKSISPGYVSKENPFGFGYKLPDMAKLEYLVIKIEDVSEIVPELEAEEIEDYYLKNRQQYMTTVPSDPNDPNSEPIQRQRTYAEVANRIAEQLRQNRIDAKADEIIQQAKRLTEAGFEQAGIDIETASTEQIKEIAGDYGQAARTLSEKYNIPVYHGKTGLLSPFDMMNDQYLGTMSVSGPSMSFVRLMEVVFAIDELQATELGLYDIPEPKMYQNLGPAQDFTGQISALLRVIDAQKAVEPDTIDLEFDKRTIQLDQHQENAYSVKEKVIQDVNIISAFDTANNEAEEFKQRLQEVGWEQAVDEWNRQYKENNELSQNEPNVLAVENLSQLRRIPESEIEFLRIQAQGSPITESMLEAALRRKQFIGRLYERVPSEQESLKTIPVIMKSEALMSSFVVRNVTINRLYRQDYQRLKAQQAFGENYRESQNLSAIHYNPDNILKRMNFSVIHKDEQPEDVNIPTEPSGRT